MGAYGDTIRPLLLQVAIGVVCYHWVLLSVGAAIVVLCYRYVLLTLWCVVCGVRGVWCAVHGALRGVWCGV